MSFLKAGGVPALAKILTAEQQLPRTSRYALAAIEALMLSCPAAACEALLGWWRPVAEDIVDKGQAEAVSKLHVILCEEIAWSRSFASALLR